MKPPKGMTQAEFELKMARFAIEIARGNKLQFVKTKLDDGRHLCIAGFRRKDETAADAKRRTIMEYHLDELLNENIRSQN